MHQKVYHTTLHQLPQCAHYFDEVHAPTDTDRFVDRRFLMVVCFYVIIDYDDRNAFACVEE